MLLEFLRLQYRKHRYRSWFLVRNLNTDSPLTDENPHTNGLQTHSKVFLQTLNLADTYPWRRQDLVERNCRPDRRDDLLYLNIELRERLRDPPIVVIQLLRGNELRIVIMTL